MRYVSLILFFLVLPALQFAQESLSVSSRLNGKWRPVGSGALGAFKEEVRLLFHEVQVQEKSGTFTGTSEQAEVSFAILYCVGIHEDTYTFRIDYEIFKPLRDRNYHPGRKNKYLIVRAETNRKGKLRVAAAFVQTPNDPNPDFSRLRKLEE